MDENTMNWQKALIQFSLPNYGELECDGSDEQVLEIERIKEKMEIILNYFST